MFSYIDPSLGVPLPERSYAENCDLTWDVIKVQEFFFVLTTKKKKKKNTRIFTCTL